MFESGERPVERQKKPLEIYDELINSYHDLVLRIKKAQRRTPRGAADEETLSLTKAFDHERHDVHVKLVELGKTIGKNKDDILVDIIRNSETLEEYGLPEFSIMRDDDLIDTGDWHNRYRFNVDSDARRVRSSRYVHKDGYKSSAVGGDGLHHEVRDEDKSVLKPDEAMIVFAIVPVTNYGDDEDAPDDYEERKRRAVALAEAVGGSVFNERDSGYHEAYARILGVTIPKADLEKTIGLIRNNPKKYRLDTTFYPEGLMLPKQRLRQINEAIKEITGEDGNVVTLPDIYLKEDFRGKKIALVDDDAEVFRTFIPWVVEASDGKAAFIPHGGQSEEELAREIEASNADIVLLDYHLSMGVDGMNVAKILKRDGFPGIILGFTSDKRVERAFKQAGALGVVNKDIECPWKFNDIAKKLREAKRD